MLDGYAVRVPMVDVNAIGAGGGSIAWLDAAKSLRVGPHSAGSEPGPACYGRGGADATVTDASIVLGYIDPAYFAGGTMTLAPELAWKAIEQKIAKPLGMSVEQAALGIHRVVNATHGRRHPLRVGEARHRSAALQPRAARRRRAGARDRARARARHAAASSCRCIRACCPPSGLLAAPVEHEAAVAFNAPRRRASTKAHARAGVLGARRALRRADGDRAASRRSSVERHYLADVCYVGQSYHLEVPVDMDGDTLRAARRAISTTLHDRIYGHSAQGAGASS